MIIDILLQISIFPKRGRAGSGIKKGKEGEEEKKGGERMFFCRDINYTASLREFL